jgi:hypothetical protein
LLRAPCVALAFFAGALSACASRSPAPPPVVVTVTAPPASTADVEALRPVEASLPDPETAMTGPPPSFVPVSAPQPPAQPLPPLSSLAPAHLVPGLASRLSNGLRFDLVVEVEVVAPGKPPALHPAGACSVTFDLWEQVYRVRVPAASGSQWTDVAKMNVDGVIRSCTDRQAYADALRATPGAIARQRIVR